jgi:hypothetical protein
VFESLGALGPRSDPGGSRGLPVPRRDKRVSFARWPRIRFRSVWPAFRSSSRAHGDGRGEFCPTIWLRPALGPRGAGRKPHLSRSNERGLASRNGFCRFGNAPQWIEQRFPKPCVGGSIPPGGTHQLPTIRMSESREGKIPTHEVGPRHSEYLTPSAIATRTQAHASVSVSFPPVAAAESCARVRSLASRMAQSHIRMSESREGKIPTHGVGLPGFERDDRRFASQACPWRPPRARLPP